MENGCWSANRKTAQEGLRRTLLPSLSWTRTHGLLQTAMVKVSRNKYEVKCKIIERTWRENRNNYKKGTTLEPFHFKLVWRHKQHKCYWSSLVQMQYNRSKGKQTRRLCLGTKLQKARFIMNTSMFYRQAKSIQLQRKLSYCC